jgi:hypothetical protein
MRIRCLPQSNCCRSDAETGFHDHDKKLDHRLHCWCIANIKT